MHEWVTKLACHGQRKTEAVATIVYSSRLLNHREREFEFPREENPEIAVAAAIYSARENLRAHPLLERRVHGDIRELVISYGATGYIALDRFLVPQHQIRVPAIHHQREIGFVV